MAKIEDINKEYIEGLLKESSFGKCHWIEIHVCAKTYGQITPELEERWKAADGELLKAAPFIAQAYIAKCENDKYHARTVKYAADYLDLYGLSIVGENVMKNVVDDAKKSREEVERLNKEVNHLLNKLSQQEPS